MSDNLTMAPFDPLMAQFVVPFAHPTHWLAGLLYLVPVFVLAGGIIWQRRQDASRREASEATSAEPTGENTTE